MCVVLLATEGGGVAGPAGALAAGPSTAAPPTASKTASPAAPSSTTSAPATPTPAASNHVESVAGLAALEAVSAANRQFIHAMRMIHDADATYDSGTESRLLTEADRLLRDIVDRFPQTDLAVKLMTNQFVGEFDYLEFRNRVKALVCNDTTATACFLYRIARLLPPIETPISVARWDWLSLAVAHHLIGEHDRAREIIGPFLATVRRGAPPDGSERDLFVARALALTGEFDIAIEITRSIDECSTRLYNYSDLVEAALWQDRRPLAETLAEEARRFATDHTCDWELGLIIQTLTAVGRTDEAKALFAQTADRQFARFRRTKDDCCPPELAVAAAEHGDVNLALGILRAVQEDNPWTIPVVLGKLGRRGPPQLVISYAEQVQDLDVRGEAYAELIEALVARKERDRADELMMALTKLAEESGGERPPLFAQLAKAERVLRGKGTAGKESWRPLFLRAVVAAERGTTYVRRDIGGPLLAALVRIETGRPMLD